MIYNCWLSGPSKHSNNVAHKLKMTYPAHGYGAAMLISDNGDAAYNKIQSVQYPDYYLDLADNSHDVKFCELRNSDRQKCDIQPIQNFVDLDNYITDIALVNVYLPNI